MKAKPAIAVLRRQNATANFKKKIEVLKQLLEDGALARYPQRISVTSFASWEDPELKVVSISRSIIYEESDEYLQLRQQMEHLLQRVEKARAKASKKGSIETELRLKLEVSEAMAQDYVNQYSTARAELLEAHKEIERLNAKLRRQTAESARISTLQCASSPRRTQGNP